MSLQEITCGSRSNDTTQYHDRLIIQLNDAADVSQDISFEDTMSQYHTQFRKAPDAIKAQMLQEINRELDLLTKQNRYHKDIQDPPQMNSQCRTFE